MIIELKVPAVGESITEVEIGVWVKAEGSTVAKDETVAIIETEKATVELPAPAAGTLTRILKPKGETAKVGEIIGHLEAGQTEPAVAVQPVSASAVGLPPAHATARHAVGRAGFG